MSFYGGGGGWGPPLQPPPNMGAPPPGQGFYIVNQGITPPVQQPPPGSYFPDGSGYNQVRGPFNYTQPGYGSYGQSQSSAEIVPSHPSTHQYSGNASGSSAPSKQNSAMGDARDSPSIRDRAKTSVERRQDSFSPSRRHSLSPEDSYGRRSASSRGKDDDVEVHRYRRSERPRRSPSPSLERDRPYSREPKHRMRSPEAPGDDYHLSEREKYGLPREVSQKSRSGQQGVDINSLLKDERLRNVLFAGISKATAKLEQSLKHEEETKDNISFLSGSASEGKSQLFPSASSSGTGSQSQQKLRSILKRKSDTEEGGDANSIFNNLSTLEKTLQMLRKSDAGDSSSLKAQEQPPPKAESKSHGALGRLASYDDDNDEESYLYGKKEEAPSEKKKKSPGVHPFWSVSAVTGSEEEDNRDPDTFEMKEKLFEKWRQSIQKSPDRPSFSNVEPPRDEVLDREARSGHSSATGNKDGGQELDSTVQNILHSIGFDFDLSQRMQQLARKKKMEEEERSTGIANQSGSFLGKHSSLTDELKASLLETGNDLSKIDSLIQEARANARIDRAGRKRESSLSPINRRNRSPDVDRSVMMRDQPKPRQSRSDWSDRDDDEPRQQSRQRSGQSYEALSPEDRFVNEDRMIRSSYHVSKPFKADDPRDEYFYPEKDPVGLPPGVPLLTSYNSRPQNEDLSSGLLKSMRVENFRVMSRPVYDNDTEEFTETRRIILPAKADRKVLSRSPSARESRSPSLRGSRKRSASPLEMSALKERRIISSQNQAHLFGRLSPDNRHLLGGSPDRSPVSHSSGKRRDSISPPDYRRPSLDYRSPSPRDFRSKYQYRERSRSPDHRHQRSPRRYRSRSPIRRRSRSPIRRRSRSPRHRRSRSRSRSRPRFRDMRSPFRRRPSRRSPERKDHRKNDSKAPSEKKAPVVKRSDSGKGKTEGPSQKLPDFSKMTDVERKLQLQKLLAEKLAAERAPQKTWGYDNIQRIIESFEKLTPLVNLEDKAKMISKLALLPGEEHVKILGNVRQRFAKVMTLKVEVVKLKKQQNELMRKNQRSGKGTEDPHLVANERAQSSVEEEIERLSTVDFDVEVRDFALEQEASPQGAQLQKTPTSVKPPVALANKTSGNLITVPVSDLATPKSSDKTALPSSKKAEVVAGKKKGPPQAPGSKSGKKDAPKAPTNAGGNKSSWTSVEVKDELPSISSSDSGKGLDKKESSSKSASKSIPTSKKKIYYEYIDSGNHYCRLCHISCNNIFPFFEHSHGKKHMNAMNKVAKPWDDAKSNKEPGKRKVGRAQTRRMKGSEMLVAVKGFYCTLCRVYCGDFSVTEKHLKSDSHYDKYLDHIRDHPKYEKNLLLDKTKALLHTQAQSKPPNGQEKAVKGKDKKAHLRVKTELDVDREEDDSGAYDKIGTVDMDLDEDERDDDQDVESKVPRMVPKPPPPFVPPPPPPEATSEDSSQGTMRDRIQPLDTFLSIKPEAPSEQEVPFEMETTPIVSSQYNISLPDIPVPVEKLPLSKPEQLSTVKSLQEVQDEERKAQEEAKRVEDEEKRMMGIDVDADVEKPLAEVKRPPLLPDASSKQSDGSDSNTDTKTEPAKPKSIDSLFAKLNKNVGNKRKAKVVSVVGVETSEMEMRIQQEIAAKVNREKEKLARQKQKEEDRERRWEERRLQKKKVYSDTSSSEESDSEGDDVEEENATAGLKVDIPLLESAPTPQGTAIAGLKVDIPLPESTPTPQTLQGGTQSVPPAATQGHFAGVYETDPVTGFDLATEVDPGIGTTKADTDDTLGMVEQVYAEAKEQVSKEPSEEIPQEQALTEVKEQLLAELNQQILGESKESTFAETGDRFPSETDEHAHTEFKDVLAKEDVLTETAEPRTEPLSGEFQEQIPTSQLTENLLELSHGGKNTVGKPQSEEVKDRLKAPKKGRTTGKKKSAAQAAGSKNGSDLSGVFSSALETISRDARRKLSKKGPVKKRGKAARGQQLQEKAIEVTPEDPEMEGFDFDMADFVVLSEVTEEDDRDNGIDSSADTVTPEACERSAQEMAEAAETRLGKETADENVDTDTVGAQVLKPDQECVTSEDTTEKSLDVEVRKAEDLGGEREQLMISEDSPTQLREIEQESPVEMRQVRQVPAVEQEQPVVDEEQSVVEQEPPIIEREQPIIEQEPPIVEREQPIIEQEQPIVEQEQPIIEQEQPIVEQEQPIVEQEQLIVEQEPPIIEQEQPIVEQEQPIVEQEPPIVEQEPPIVEQEQPIVEQEQPIIEQEQPIVEQEQPIVEQEQPADSVPEEEVALPSAGRSGARGRGKKSGRGRGRGRRAVKKEQVDESLLADKDSGIADEELQEVQVMNEPENESSPQIDESEIGKSRSPSKRGRRGRAAATSGRVTRSTRSRTNKAQNQAVAFDQSEAVINESLTTNQEAVEPQGGKKSDSSMTQTLKASDETDGSSRTVGLETADRHPGPQTLPTEDDSVVKSPSLNYVTSDPFQETALPGGDAVKDVSDSDATITEEVEDPAVLSHDPHTGGEMASDLPSLEEKMAPGLDSSVDQSEMMPMEPVYAVAGSSPWEQPAYQADFGSGSAPPVSGLEQEITSLTSPGTGQLRDPPMSGIVGELDAPDVVLMDMEEGGDDCARMEGVHSETEGLLPSGLGWDLPDVTDAMAFPLEAEDSSKTDSS